MQFFQKVDSLHTIPAMNRDQSVNVVIEIPAGTSGKWEVCKQTGDLRLESNNDQPRIVQYLPYVANYGMIPQTLSPKEFGGDGDPLDVVLLGEAVPRGLCIRCRLVGLMVTVDNEEIDDKVIAVAEGSVFADVQSIEDLRLRFPGTLEILKTWFENYKGPNGNMKVREFMESSTAYEILAQAIEGYQKSIS